MANQVLHVLVLLINPCRYLEHVVKTHFLDVDIDDVSVGEGHDLMVVSSHRVQSP